MTVVSSEKDLENLSLKFVAEFDAPIERVWQLWQDPRTLERWWGPPTYPATFEHHDFVVGGHSSYFMTGPEGQKAHGWWQITDIDEPHRLEFDDGFATEEGERIDAMGVTHAVMTLTAIDTGTRMTLVSVFPTAEILDQMVGMGMVEGMTLALNQIDGVLASSEQ